MSEPTTVQDAALAAECALLLTLLKLPAYGCDLERYLFLRLRAIDALEGRLRPPEMRPFRPEWYSTLAELDLAERYVTMLEAAVVAGEDADEHASG